LSDAVAARETVPETVAPFAGAVNDTVGAVVSVLLTVTVTVDEVVEFPAASRATAVRACEPFERPAVFHDTEYGDVVSSDPIVVPSALNTTPTTPTLSDAFADTVTVPWTLAPPAGAVIDTVGAVVSELFTVTVTGPDVVELPAASRATAVSVYEPFASVVVFHDTAYGEDVSSDPMFVVPCLNWTPTTPTLSDAVAVRDTVPETVAPLAGAVRETVGAVVSGTDPTGVFMSAWISVALSARP
jgi:hypothetical protein